VASDGTGARVGGGTGPGWSIGVDRALAVLADGGALEGASLADLGGFVRDPFGGGAVGLVWDRIALDRGEAHLDVRPELHQPAGIVHGGVWCSVVESMASVCGAMNAMRSGKVVVGVHNATDFLRPHREGRVTGVATPVQVGRTQQLWLVELSRASDGRPVARGQVRLANITPETAGG
jgi:1,4-dihydroxy-2-naphthoyl-CoA hydrolase